MNKRIIASVVVVGGVALAGGSTVLSHSGQAAAVAATRSTVQSATTAGSARSVAGAPGARGQFGGRGHGARGQFGGGRAWQGQGRGLTVVSVDAATNTITAKNRQGTQVTITVSATTTYSEAGTTVGIAAVTSGEHIAVRGQASSNGSSLQATAITIQVPGARGVVTATTATSLTITAYGGASETINVNAQTTITRLGKTLTLGDISAGEAISAEGTLQSGGSLTALRIVVQVPSVFGKVQTVSGTTYTLTGRGGQTITVNAAGATYVNGDGSAANAGDVKQGTLIAAQGTVSADGTSVTAERIVIAPAARFGFGHQPGAGTTGTTSTHGV